MKNRRTPSIAAKVKVASNTNQQVVLLAQFATIARVLSLLAHGSVVRSLRERIFGSQSEPSTLLA